MENWLIHELAKAYTKARGGKRRTFDEHNFELHWLENVMRLSDDILSRNYRPSRGIAFITRRPVIREIFAAPFRDRVVHHFLFDMVADWWDRRLIYDSYSCRKGKGVLFGVERLAKHIRNVSKCYTEEAYVIKLDVQGYFMSLPRKRLYERALWGLNRQFPDGGWLYDILKFLWRQIIFDNPTEGVRRRGRLSDWDDLPPTKSLFNQPPGQGIVIGNLSSQLLSNIYLDMLDRFITRDLGYKHYGRYVDDFYMVLTRQEYGRARRQIGEIAAFLKKIGLTLHPHKRYMQEVHRGVAFLGAVVYPGYVVPGRRVMREFERAAREFGMGWRERESVVSYMGHLEHLDSRKMVAGVFERHGWRYNF